jgi:predicted nucleic acid-binding protein
MTVVIDASVLVDFYIGSEAVDAIASRIRGEVLQAPVTVDAEVVHSLRRQTLAGRIDVALAEHALRRFIATQIVRHPVEPLVPRMWSLRRNITAYDASYVALAESLDLPFITRDARLARSSGHSARIEYID